MSSFTQLGTLTATELIRQTVKQDFQTKVIEEYQKLMALEDLNTYYHFMLPENQDKNRYRDIPCADFSRVELMGDDKSSYIHANHVFGFDLNYYNVGYIATQVPLKNTIEDFWRMIWQENSRIIVMLVKLEENKCAPYWNTVVGNYLVAGKFKVTTVLSYNNCRYIQTTLILTNRETREMRQIHHYLYDRWPVHGVPENFEDFLNFINTIHEKCESFRNNASCGPIIVHCSGGVGRTGTFCAIMNGIKSLQQTCAVNVFEIVKEIRNRRSLSVIVEEQYIFCYKILAYYVTFSYVLIQHAN